MAVSMGNSLDNAWFYSYATSRPDKVQLDPNLISQSPRFCRTNIMYRLVQAQVEIDGFGPKVP